MAGSLPAVVAEIREIEAIMPDSGSLYWRDPDYQVRLRSLYEARDGTELADAEAIDLGDYMTALAPIRPKDVGEVEEGFDYNAYVRACSLAADVVLSAPPAERPGLIASFNRLPDDVAGAIGAELTNRTGTGFAYCSDQQVATFATYPGGRVVREWGSEAPVLMARARARIFRAMDSMTVLGEERFMGWLESLTDGQAAAVYRKLAI